MKSYCLFECENCIDRDICLNSEEVSYCKNCGKEIKGDRTFCSVKCREAYLRRIRKEIEKLESFNDKHFSLNIRYQIEEGQYILNEVK